MIVGRVLFVDKTRRVPATVTHGHFIVGDGIGRRGWPPWFVRMSVGTAILVWLCQASVARVSSVSPLLVPTPFYSEVCSHRLNPWASPVHQT